MICFVAHLVIYASVVRIFGVTRAAVKNALFFALSFLSFSFILAVILIRSRISAAARIFYLFSGFWAGLAINILLSLIIYFTIMTVARRARLNKKAVGSAALSAALIFSVYGVWNAFHPVIKNIEAAMPNLPQSWRGRTIVQITDVHLGAAHTSAYFSRMAAQINAQRPSLIVITGDLFDSISESGLTEFIEPLRSLKAEFGVIYVNGNHENYIGMDGVNSMLEKTGITALRDDVINIDGLQIIGVNYPEYGTYRDIVKVISGQKVFRKGAPTILLYHTPTNIAQRKDDAAERQTSTYWRPDIDYGAAKALGVNLQLSGHTHRGQIFPFTLLTPRLYHGYDYGLHDDGNGFSIYTSSGLGTFGPPMRTGNRPEIVVIRLN